MKYLTTIALIIFGVNAHSQSEYYKRMKERIINTPPAYYSGFGITEAILSKKCGVYAFEINDGTYFKLNKHDVESDILIHEIDVKDILYNEKKLTVWVDSGKIKSSFDGIKAKTDNNIFLLYVIDIVIIENKIYSTKIIDYRGCQISTLSL